MSPSIYCIRHAQGFHNLSSENHAMPDPLLTELGYEQCRKLAQNFPYHDRIELVVASPIKRTIYTALEVFDEIIRKKGLKVVALPEVQETSDLPCDTGSSKEELEKEFKGRPVDLSLVTDTWNNKKGKWAPTSTAIQNRAREARLWLMSRDEKEIAVITHGGFLHYFSEDWSDNARFFGTEWSNCELRVYGFSAHEPEEAHLVEVPDSRSRRKQEAETKMSLDMKERAKLNRTVAETPGDTTVDQDDDQTRQDMAVLAATSGIKQIPAKV